MFTKSILRTRPSSAEKPSLLYTLQSCGSSLGTFLWRKSCQVGKWTRKCFSLRESSLKPSWQVTRPILFPACVLHSCELEYVEPVGFIRSFCNAGNRHKIALCCFQPKRVPLKSPILGAGNTGFMHLALPQADSLGISFLCVQCYAVCIEDAVKIFLKMTCHSLTQ